MIINRKLVVEISDAKFHFTKPNLKFLLELEGFKNSNEYIARVFSMLTKVEGILDEDGNNFIKEETLYLDLPFDVVMQVIEQWNKQVFGKKEAEEKNAPAQT